MTVNDKKITVSAIIVAYNPDIEKLKNLIISAHHQFNHIILINNGTFSIKIQQSIITPFNIKYIELGENYGIAYAQNLGMNQAKELNSTFAMLLDQDSLLPANMVTALLSAHTKIEQENINIASIAPCHRDQKTGHIGEVIRYNPLYSIKTTPQQNSSIPIKSDFNIASGSLIKLDNFFKIGPMMECLFIDWVDIEWGLRAKHEGFLSFAIPNVILDHNIGDETKLIMGKPINLHNNIRNYYILRNAAFLLKHKKMGYAWRIHTALRIPKYYLFYSLTSRNKIKSLRRLASAMWDGISSNMGKIKNE